MLPQPYYADDLVTLYHGDAYEIAPLIEGVDALITDPPYGTGMEFFRMGGAPAGRTPKERPRWGRIVGDDKPFDPTPFLGYPVVILWGANYYADKLPPSRGWVVWDKRGDVAIDQNSDCELAWTNQDRVIRQFTHCWRGVARASETGSPLHPTQKPVALMRWLIDKYTQPNDLILDPFMGSGPLARAAKDLGRRYVGIEIEQQYLDAAVGRCRQEVLL